MVSKGKTLLGIGVAIIGIVVAIKVMDKLDTVETDVVVIVGGLALIALCVIAFKKTISIKIYFSGSTNVSELVN